MTNEESLEFLQKVYHEQVTGKAPTWIPQFTEAIKTAINLLIIEVSKQKMKEYLKQEENKNEHNDGMDYGNGEQGEGRDGI